MPLPGRWRQIRRLRCTGDPHVGDHPGLLGLRADHRQIIAVGVVAPVDGRAVPLEHSLAVPALGGGNRPPDHPTERPRKVSREYPACVPTARSADNAGREILLGLAQDPRAKGIAEGSYTSTDTVRTHIRSIRQKLGVTTQMSAVALANQAG